MSVLTQQSSPIDAAARISTTLPDRALEVEIGRTLPEDLVTELRDVGLFHLMTPARLGGLEVDPATLVRVVESLSYGDAATGWTVLIGQGAGYLAWLRPDAAEGIVDAVGGRLPIIVGSMAPVGRVVSSDLETVTLTGRWQYNSGCHIADMLIGGFRLPDAEGDGVVRFAVFPREAATVHDTWRAAGMRGTGSHDVEVVELPVPLARTFDPFGPAQEDGALYRLPYMSYLLVALAGFPLGVGRRIVDEYRKIVLVKRNTERTLLAETPVVQAEVARCEGTVRAAKAFVEEAIAQIWVEAGDGIPSLPARALLSAAVQNAMRAALDVADSAMRACGASQLYHRAPLQRFFRDAQVAAQHLAFGLEAQRRVGAALLGLPVGPSVRFL
jgi:alkylation response protein AidB-like acyl-CoA dehydrogenase